jgi:hypothetical protein
MRQRGGAYRVSVGKLEGMRPLEYPGVDGRIILNWIVDKWDRVHGLDRSCSEQGQVAGFC